MKISLLVAAILLICSCDMRETQIHEWRGEDRNGIYPDTDLLDEWPEDGPAELWYIDGIGNGNGSPVIFKGSILFMVSKSHQTTFLPPGY